MKCIEFKDWLENRDIYSKELDIAKKEHMKNCPGCRQLYELDSGLEIIIQNEFSVSQVPASLMDKIDNNLFESKNKESIFKSFQWAKLVPAVCVAVLIVYFVFPFSSNRFEDLQQISSLAVQDHMKQDFQMTFTRGSKENALQALRKELGFNIILPDIKNKDYMLIGGRKCKLGACDAVYLFYEKFGKIVSVFVFNDDLDFSMADGSRYNDMNKGYDIEIWKGNGQVYAMVN